MRGLRGRGRGEVDVRGINCQTTAGYHTIYCRSDSRAVDRQNIRIAADISADSLPEKRGEEVVAWRGVPDPGAADCYECQN